MLTDTVHTHTAAAAEERNTPKGIQSALKRENHRPCTTRAACVTMHLVGTIMKRCCFL